MAIHSVLNMWDAQHIKYRAGIWIYKFEADLALACSGKAVCLSSVEAVLASVPKTTFIDVDNGKSRYVQSLIHIQGTLFLNHSGNGSY